MGITAGVKGCQVTAQRDPHEVKRFKTKRFDEPFNAPDLGTDIVDVIPYLLMFAKAGNVRHHHMKSASYHRQEGSESIFVRPKPMEQNNEIALAPLKIRPSAMSYPDPSHLQPADQAVEAISGLDERIRVLCHIEHEVKYFKPKRQHSPLEKGGFRRQIMQPRMARRIPLGVV